MPTTTSICHRPMCKKWLMNNIQIWGMTKRLSCVQKSNFEIANLNFFAEFKTSRKESNMHTGIDIQSATENMIEQVQSEVSKLNKHRRAHNHIQSQASSLELNLPLRTVWLPEYMACPLDSARVPSRFYSGWFFKARIRIRRFRICVSVPRILQVHNMVVALNKARDNRTTCIHINIYIYIRDECSKATGDSVGLCAWIQSFRSDQAPYCLWLLT